MMRLPRFSYRTPRTIAEAVKIIGDTGPEGQFVAGGTDLYPNTKGRQQTPRTVISVMRLPELNQITGEGGSGLVIGGSVTLTDICEHPVIKRDYPVIASAARTISTPILRNMGTIGGNLLLDTRCNYYDQNYEWRKGINFCLKKDGDGIDYLKKRADELLVDIHLPPTNGWRASYQKLRRRGAFDFPVLGVAACIHYESAHDSKQSVSTGRGSDRVITDAKI